MARSLRRLVYAVVLSLGAAGALVVTLGTQASASPSKATARVTSAATSQTVVNSATPTTGPVPTTCAGPTVNSERDHHLLLDRAAGHQRAVELPEHVWALARGGRVPDDRRIGRTLVHHG